MHGSPPQLLVISVQTPRSKIKLGSHSGSSSSASATGSLGTSGACLALKDSDVIWGTNFSCVFSIAPTCFVVVLRSPRHTNGGAVSGFRLFFVGFLEHFFGKLVIMPHRPWLSRTVVAKPSVRHSPPYGSQSHRKFWNRTGRDRLLMSALFLKADFIADMPRGPLSANRRHSHRSKCIVIRSPRLQC